MFLYSILVVLLFVNSSTSSPNEKCSTYISKMPGFSCLKEDKIGEGSNGITFLVTKNKKSFVFKIQTISKLAEAEIKALKAFKGRPFLTQLVQSSQDDENIYSVITLGKQGTLAQMLTKSNYFKKYGNVLKFFHQLVIGVKEIRRAGFVHADLKASNVAVNENFEPMIIDFDMSVPVGSETFARGTISYMAPEVVYSFEKNEDMRFTSAVDVFSLGVILFKMVHLRFPYNLFEISYPDVLTQRITFRPEDHESFFKLVSACVKPESSRVSLDQLMQMAERAYVKPNPATLGKKVTYMLKDFASEDEVKKIYDFTHKGMGVKIMIGGSVLLLLVIVVYLAFLFTGTVEKKNELETILN